jgi:hypothetical protein
MSDAAAPKSPRDALLEDGLLVLYRIDGNRVDYTLPNRPEPTLSGLNDHLLATALVEAGSRFTFERQGFSTHETMTRDDGRAVTYKSSIDIDWEARTIRGSERRKLTLRVLSVLVHDLMTSAMQAKSSSPHGLN